MTPFPDHLFWDCDPKSVDPEKHCRFIIGRVLSRGRMDDWNKLRELYGHDRLKSEVVQLRSLDPKSLSFCCAYFELNKEDFRCYSKTPSLSPKPSSF